MIKSYLVMDKGLIAGKVYHLEKRVTMGRSGDNIIHVSDSSVSRHHAVLYFEKDRAVVEDLGSHNGTFVNQKPVKRALLADGDVLRIGSVVLRFLQEEITEAEALLAETLEVAQSTVSVSAPDRGAPGGSQRLMEVISKVPLFASLDDDALARVSQLSRLAVFDRGRIIFRQGDRAESLYIILDGKAQVSTRDQHGKDLLIAILSDGQCFGETSFLTGAPQPATVQTVEETLLGEVRFGPLRDLMGRSPLLKAVLEAHCRERLREAESRKREAGLIERRRYPRFNERLRITLSVPASDRARAEGRRNLFPCTSADISVSGVRVQSHDRTLAGLPLGSHLALEIRLPDPWGPFHSLGALRNLVEERDGTRFTYLMGIEFLKMSVPDRKKLEGFLQP
jgi:pSer/pThr/pTyr-binding forkhead associated (FHA) protein